MIDCTPAPKERPSAPVACAAGTAGPYAPPALAFVSVRTVGFDLVQPGDLDGIDLLELAVVRVDGRTLEVLGEHAALAVTGDVHCDAVGHSKVSPMRQVLLAITPLLEDAVLAGCGVTYLAELLDAVFLQEHLQPPRVRSQRLEVTALAWPLLASGALGSLKLDELARCFDIVAPQPRSALGDARCTVEVARRLGACMVLGHRLNQLAGDERQIAEVLLDRLELGRRQYGPWRVDDGRAYATEALAEVVDALHYCAAQLVRQARPEGGRRRRVYVCHPFASDPRGHIERVREISRRLLEEGVVPVAPHLYVPQLLDEGSNRETALALCLDILATCDEVRVFGTTVTSGMEREIRFAVARGIPVCCEAGAKA